MKTTQGIIALIVKAGQWQCTKFGCSDSLNFKVIPVKIQKKNDAINI